MTTASTDREDEDHARSGLREWETMSTGAVDGHDHAALSEATAEHLNTFGVEPKLAALVLAVSGHRRLQSRLVAGNYVSVAPFQGGFIAAYVYQRDVSVALSPRRAEAVGAEHGWRVEADSGITSCVHNPVAALASESAHSAALQLLLESVDWRAAGGGEARNGGSRTAAPVRPAAMCPVHHTEMLGGGCDVCD